MGWVKKNGPMSTVVKVDRRISGTTLLLYFAFALVHDSRGIDIVNFTISLALSAGTLMATAGTPYRLVPAHFYPCMSISGLGALIARRDGARVGQCARFEFMVER